MSHYAPTMFAFNNKNTIVKRVMHMKGRRTCNQPCAFSDCNKLELHEPGDKALTSDHIVRPATDENLQIAPVQALSTCNTDNFIFTAKGVTHFEGGWPKDVNCLDNDQVTRHRKKIERHDTYGKQVVELCNTLEKVIMQNNAVNIYQDYFREAEPLPVSDKCCAKTRNTFKDFTGEKVWDHLRFQCWYHWQLSWAIGMTIKWLWLFFTFLSFLASIE